MSEELNLEPIEKRLAIAENIAAIDWSAECCDDVMVLVEDDIPAMLKEIKQLRAALGRRGAQEEPRCCSAPQWEHSWRCNHCGAPASIMEAQTLTAALRGVGTPQEKDLERYDAAHERFQRGEIRALKQTVVALVRQLTAAHLVARVTPLDVAVDPIEVSRRYDPATGDDLLWVPLGTLHQEEKDV